MWETLLIKMSVRLWKSFLTGQQPQLPTNCIFSEWKEGIVNVFFIRCSRHKSPLSRNILPTWNVSFLSSGLFHTLCKTQILTAVLVSHISFRDSGVQIWLDMNSDTYGFKKLPPPIFKTKENENCFYHCLSLF